MNTHRKSLALIATGLVIASGLFAMSLNPEPQAATGACKKCTCPQFREDATDGKCLNIQPPHPNKLCQHTRADHES